MSDPTSIKGLKLPVPDGSITALALCRSFDDQGDFLWIGSSDGCIHIADPLDDYALCARLESGRRNYNVVSIVEFPGMKCVLVHWLGGALQPGPVHMYSKSGQDKEVKYESVDIFCAGDGKFAIVSQGCIRAFEFTARPRVIVSKQVDAKAVALCDSHLVYFDAANGAYWAFGLKDASLVALPTAPIGKPMVVAAARDSVVVRYKEFFLVWPSGLKLRAQGVDWVLPVQGRWLYEFRQSSFARVPLAGGDPLTFDVPKVRCAAFIRQELVIVGPMVLVVSALPDPAKYADRMLKGDKGELLKKLPPEAIVEFGLEVFCAAWQKDPAKALAILASCPIPAAASGVVGLVRDFRQAAPPTRGSQVRGVQRMVEPTAECSQRLGEHRLTAVELAKVVGPLASFLKAVLWKAADRRLVATSLAKCWAVAGNLRELDEVLETGTVDVKAVREFASAARLQTAATLLRGWDGDVEGALAEWESSGNAQEFAYTLRLSTDAGSLPAHLTWLRARGEDAVRIAILSKNHDPTVLGTWLTQNKLDSLRPRYLTFLVDCDNRVRAASVAGDAVRALAPLIAQEPADKAGCERALGMTFADAAAAREAVVERILQILGKFGESIDVVETTRLLGPGIDKRVQVALLRCRGDYTAAVEVLLAAQASQQELEGFCRECPDPGAAFGAWFSKLEFKKWMSIAEANMAWLDASALIALIPKSTQLRTVVPLVRAALNIAQCRKLSVEQGLEINAGLLAEWRYREAFEQSRFYDLSPGLKCSGCDQQIAPDQPIVFAQEGGAYHKRCQP